MALVIINTDSEALDSSYLTLDDTTGVYNVSSNPEAYGTAAELNTVSDRNIANIDSGIIELYYPESTEADETYNLSGAEMQDIASQTTSYTFSAPNTTYSAGVYKTLYKVLFPSIVDVEFTFTEDSNSVTVENTAGDLLDELVNVNAIVLNGTTYQIASLTVVSLSVTTLLLTEIYYGTTTTETGDNILLQYNCETYLAVKNQINECLQNKIADMAISPCGCDKSDLVNYVVLYDAITANMDAEDYTKAQDIITALSNYCDSTSCSCK